MTLMWGRARRQRGEEGDGRQESWGIGGRRLPVVRVLGVKVKDLILDNKTASLAFDLAASTPFRPLGSEAKTSSAAPSDDDGSRRRIVIVYFGPFELFGSVRFGSIDGSFVGALV